MRKRIFLLLTALLVLSGLGSPGAGAAPPRQGQVHVVQPGETLWAIALKYGVTPAELTQANGITDPHSIHPGQKLTIPTAGSVGTTASPAYHTVQRGESLHAIAAHYGVSTDILARANGISNPNLIHPGQQLRIPPPGTVAERSHIVEPGETLAGIALRYNVAISTLVQSNRLSGPNLIYVGQELRIPAEGFPVVPASPAPSASKLIEIDVSDQRMTVWENGQVKWYWVCSTGEWAHPTSTGHFSVLSKIPSAYSSYYRLQMPWWLGIYWVGSAQNGIHALPILSSGRTLWSGYLGQRISYGCIVLDTGNAKALYDWADLGTPVNIHY